MGRGIVSLNGSTAAAVERFALPLTLVDSQVRGVAKPLLEGRRVRSRDDHVTVTFGAQGKQTEIYVRATAADVAYKIVIHLRPLTLQEIASLPQGAADRPDPATPDAWQVFVSETEQDWELFNCNVSAVIIAQS